MPKTAHLLTPVFALLSLSTAYCLLPTSLHAYQECPTNQDCVVGEFLFDDNYTPIATASCTLTTKDPAGSDLLTNEPLSGQADGWYAHTFAPAAMDQGLYRSQICCTVDSDYLCLDKSFVVGNNSVSAGEISSAVWDASLASHSGNLTFGGALQNVSTLTQTDVQSAVWDATASGFTTGGSFGSLLQNLSTLTAADIWSYSTRSLTGFGTLIADIWSYSTRSLTGFGDLVNNIWEGENRTLTSPNAADLASKTDLNNQTNTLKSDIAALKDIQTARVDYSDPALLLQISRQVSENRDLLELLVNEPIVKSFIEDGETPDLSQKLNQTQKVVSELYADVQQLDSRLGLLNLKLNQMTRSEAALEIKSLETLLGSADSPADASLTANLTWFDQAWGTPLPQSLLTVVQVVRGHLTDARINLDAGSVAAAQTELLAAAKSLVTLSDGVGDVTNLASDRTLFGKFKEVQALASALDQNEQAIAQVVSAWDTTPDLQKQPAVAKLKQAVLKANRLPQAASILDSADSKPEKKVKNQVLGLQAVTVINRVLLAKMAGEPVKGLWLEEGSVVFKILVTNPSDRVAQTVPVSYVLPREVKQEHIMVTPPGITIEYNPDEEALYAKGEFELVPGETKTFAIEVNDIWVIDQAEIDSLSAQAEELMKPLLKTAFFGQGATIKSDIDVALKKIIAATTDGVTPEARIKAYREAQIELAGVRDKLDKLKDLVAQAGSSGSIFGFIGGVQAVAVWGIIIIFIAGFVFLTLYMRSLRAHESGSLPAAAPAKPLNLPLLNPRLTGTKPARTAPRLPTRVSLSLAATGNPGSTRLFLLLVGILSSVILGVMVLSAVLGRVQPAPMVNPSPPSLSGLDSDK